MKVGSGSKIGIGGHSRCHPSHTTGHTGQVPGGSTRLSLVRNMKSRETERVEVVVAQCLLNRVEANPPTRYTPADSDVVRAYLERGGSLLMLVEPDYMVDQTLASVLAETGIRLGDGGRLSTLSQYPEQGD